MTAGIIRTIAYPSIHTSCIGMSEKLPLIAKFTAFTAWLNGSKLHTVLNVPPIISNDKTAPLKNTVAFTRIVPNPLTALFVESTLPINKPKLINNIATGIKVKIAIRIFMFNSNPKNRATPKQQTACKIASGMIGIEYPKM